ncbi:hypothetical protein CLV30_106121 [Haloactinopolyspora alba]|uniref:Uncharacterized protein n=1 Tax=Haloactinopolyspora alba TaxID=648780 RepID=A0A2P8E3R7_9ACTN|nr:hypothetical protein [Haloactinopolyspora alba]PSL04118.1 hypothetical protein CLV30_106121 [Haloactinopolyspora alba]
MLNTVFASREDVADGYVRIVSTRSNTTEGHTVPLTIIRQANDGAWFDGYSVDRSNYRSLIRDFGIRGEDENGILVKVSYCDGYGLAFVGRDDTTMIGQIAQGLAEQYAVYDETDWSELEDEDQSAYLEDGAVHDFRRDLRYRDDVSEAEYDALDDLDHNVIEMALRESVSEHDHYGDWDGTGYRAWSDIVESTRRKLATVAA